MALKLRSDGSRDEEKQYLAPASPTAAPGFESAPGYTETAHRKYAYDNTGALLSIATLLPDGGVAATAGYLHDKDGRRVSEPGATAQWNVEGRLTQQNVVATATVANVTYDAMGLRRTVNATVGGVAQPTQSFTWGNENGEGEVAADNARVVSVAGIVIAQGGQRFAHDALGSTIARVDSSGTLGVHRYGVFGTFEPGTVTTPPREARYTNHAYVNQTQLYAQQRYYDTTTGQLLSEDPLRGDLMRPSTTATWSYAASNPMRWVDLDGRQGEEYGGLASFMGCVGQSLGGGSFDDCMAEQTRMDVETKRRLYSSYHSMIQAGGNAVHSGSGAAGDFVQDVTGSEVAGAGVATFGEFVAGIPVGIAGVATVPEFLWDAPSSLKTSYVEYNAAPTSTEKWLAFSKGLGTASGVMGVVSGGARAAGVTGPRLPPPSALLAAGDSAFARYLSAPQLELVPAGPEIPNVASQAKPGSLLGNGPTAMAMAGPKKPGSENQSSEAPKHSKRSRIRDAGLPGAGGAHSAKGPFRFLLDQGYQPGNAIERGGRGGYIDRFGNEWVEGPYHGDPSKGFTYEWDVQLSARGKKWAKALLEENPPTKEYINVAPDGTISH